MMFSVFINSVAWRQGLREIRIMCGRRKGVVYKEIHPILIKFREPQHKLISRFIDNAFWYYTLLNTAQKQPYIYAYVRMPIYICILILTQAAWNFMSSGKSMSYKLFSNHDGSLHRKIDFIPFKLVLRWVNLRFESGRYIRFQDEMGQTHKTSKIILYFRMINLISEKL